jgi:hypothetical protein
MRAQATMLGSRAALREALLPAARCAMLAAALGCSGSRTTVAHGGVVATGGGRDAAVRADAGADGSPSDASAFDNTIYSGKRLLCGYDAKDVLTLAGNAMQPEVAVATDEQGFALLFHDETGSLFIEAVPVDGVAQDPVAIVSGADAPAGVSIVASGSHFLLGWRDQASAAQTLRTRELTTVDHPVVELTSALAPTTTGGELSVLLGQDDGFLAGWLEQGDSGNELRLQRIASDGARSGDPVTVAGVGARAPEDVHLARLDAGRTLLAWLERDAQGQGHVMSLALAADLTSKGKPTELSKNGAHDARFGLAARKLSAGLLYHALDGDVRDALKYRRIDPQGQAAQPVLNIVDAPGRVRDGSITAFGQGYAVAYRALPSLGVDHPAIHVAFINQFGEVVHHAELAETTETGAPTAIAATADGHLLVGWSSQPASGAATHALALYCPGALVLCGGEVK